MDFQLFNKITNISLIYKLNQILLKTAGKMQNKETSSNKII